MIRSKTYNWAGNPSSMENGITFNMGDNPSYHLGLKTCHPYVLSGGSAGRIERLAERFDRVEKMASDRKHAAFHGDSRTG